MMKLNGVRIITALIMAIAFLSAVGSAYIDNYTVLDTFPDGGAKHGTSDVVGYGVSEITWNSYGHALDTYGHYDLNKAYESDMKWLKSGRIQKRMPMYLKVYIDSNEEIISYKEANTANLPFNIQSNKTPLSVPPYERAGISAQQYMIDNGLTPEYMFDGANYQAIYDDLYKLTPEYQIQRINELEKINKTLEHHERKLNFIWEFINQTFGISLW